MSGDARTAGLTLVIGNKNYSSWALYAPVVLHFRSYDVAFGGVERRYSDALLALPAMREWFAAAETEGLPLPEYDAIA